MTNMQAALGVAQLDRVDEIVAHKRAMAAAYTERLRSCEALQLPTEREWARSTFWMYGVVLKVGGRSASGLAADLAKRLQERGVQTRPFFLGMHEQPAFHRMGLFVGERVPGHGDARPPRSVPAFGNGAHRATGQRGVGGSAGQRCMSAQTLMLGWR